MLTRIILRGAARRSQNRDDWQCTASPQEFPTWDGAANNQASKLGSRLDSGRFVACNLDLIARARLQVETVRKTVVAVKCGGWCASGRGMANVCGEVCGGAGHVRFNQVIGHDEDEVRPVLK